ncbi:glutamine--fructose-6-phosphate transaminase (isomerizing) [Natrarchaeobaculum aegyptiacum]|uniref:Glutamine--fructose-6-phosphate aminotransferase [isomerizing] n=1 Tax=Natrarchaeobaculum aegyptiacum TaxID=745377 RepID=A0A2Z2HUG7_9EURY|nr:glutamine--fructose-6-phosphate transaminase (isomerizing) [Natrarchaeobaculum aegyptiacum]ARS90822.1 glutamine--fructose-6-phosphate transaminase (isomerizing) [Natrarchaeobaculum aegyptiacum]
MCGIVGYTGDEAAGPLVSAGLENLEYRGYDSAGVALVGDDLTVAKRAGEVGELSVPDAPGATTAIGHTRWSTHGPPTDGNAHPHCSQSGEVAVVHNGIIQNYEALRRELEADGYAFASDTDTEVVPHLLERELEGGHDLLSALEAVVDRLDGSYAIAAVRAGRDRIVATRHESPLVIGHGDDGSFLASDVTAFLEHTRSVTYLEDDDLVALEGESVTVYRGGGTVEPAIETVEWEADAAEKAGYDHYMRKEIHEQPAALRQTLSGRVDRDRGDVDLDVSFPQGYLDSLEEVQFVACGTSYYASLYGAQLLEELADVRTSVEIASEYRFNGGRDPWRTLVVAVTQSGETADTLGAIREAAGAGARTLAVTNTLGSTVTRETDETAFIRAGPEIGVAATKTFASQVTTLALLAVRMGRERGQLSAAEARDVLADLRGLPGAVQQVLDEDEQVLETAREYQDASSFFFVGRRFGYPVALEGALKLKEISYDHAEGFAAGELKHGPLALVDDDTPVLAVLTEAAEREATMHNVVEAQTRGAPAIGVVSSAGEGGSVDVALEVPSVGLFEPLVANVYFQLFAYHVANLKGRSIDKPRNLAKSVTVE